MKSEKIKWLNGIKGICAVFVFIHHYALRFYDTIYYGVESIQKTSSGIDVLLASEPYGVITNGNFYVIIFITITGFIFAYKRFANLYKENDGLSIFINRYIQLLFLCLAGCVFYFSCNYIYSYINPHYNVVPTEGFAVLVKRLLFLQWFDRSLPVLGLYWPMKYFLFGSLIAYYISQISNEKRWYSSLVYIMLGIGAKYTDVYFSAILFGVALADIYYYDRLDIFTIRSKSKKREVLFSIIGALLFILGIFFGGYPTYAEPTNAIYLLIKNTINGDGYYYRCIASFVMMFGIMISPIKNVFETKCFQLLGSISSEIYVTHSIVIGIFSNTVFQIIKTQTGSYGISFLITFIPSLVFVVGVAIIYKKYISSIFHNLTK